MYQFYLNLKNNKYFTCLNTQIKIWPCIFNYIFKKLVSLNALKMFEDIFENLKQIYFKAEIDFLFHFLFVVFTVHLLHQKLRKID